MGYFKVDTSDFDEIWTAPQNHNLFILYSTLMRDAWRQNEKKHVLENSYMVTLSKFQLILRIRTIVHTLGLAESTVRDRLKKLIELEVIRIDEPVPKIKIVTILRAYTYYDHGERVPCIYRAPSVVDLRNVHGHTALDPLQEPCKKFLNNDLQRPYTDILRDSRLEDSEDQSKLVRRESFMDRDETDECCEIDDEGFPSDAKIDILINELCGRNPELQPEQVKEWAKSSQPIESILGHQK